MSCAFPAIDVRVVSSMVPSSCYPTLVKVERGRLGHLWTAGRVIDTMHHMLNSVGGVEWAPAHHTSRTRAGRNEGERR